ncbi:MAG TPA: CHAT domain-containing protein [Bryobacteraceae bacterium]|nr:CHAT domain-containing protein [Bryobacteraceae bacterium]
MRASIWGCCLFAVSFVGGAGKTTPVHRALPLLSAEQRARRVAPYRERLERGRELFRNSQYSQAAPIFQSVFEDANAHALPEVAGRALGNWGGCQYAMHQYQAALRAYLEARRLYQAGGDTAGVALLDTNLASLYHEMGAVDASAQWIERSMKQALDPARAKHLPELQLQMAMIRAQQGRMAEAAELFRKGIDGADQQGNLELYFKGWNRWGEALLEHGEFPRAEAALLRAFYAGKIHRLDLVEAYGDLGRLRQAQGDLTSASVLLDRAVELTNAPQGSTPTWNLYHARGTLRFAQGRIEEALNDLRIALRLGRAWRWSAPSDDTNHVANERRLAELHSTFTEVGNRLYLTTHDPALIRETFEADEENRAASLRSLIRDPETSEPDLPSAYWEAMGRLQDAEIAALRGTAQSGGIAAARAELVHLDAALGPELRPLPPNLAEATSLALHRDSAFFSFHLGDAASWVWALDRDGIEVYALPPRRAIETQCRALVKALAQSQTDANELSAALFRTLFGPVSPRFRKASRWLLALDATLFEVPVAALVEVSAPNPIYVAERHIVESVPGAAYWLESLERPEPHLSSVLVGVGDPIYNRADARLRHSYSGSDILPLPRLVASGSEVESSAKAWEGPAVLLRGQEASRENLLEQLRRKPAAVHVSTHYLESAAQSHYALIALSLTPSGQMELLSPFEISHWRVATGLVVLSGCHSAAGAAIPGAGVLGLTRAWLAAGAQSVVGTLWNTPDDDGILFRAFYQSLHRSAEFDAARALRDAQLELIHSGGRWARPDYWGAYFVVGNQGKAVTPQ